MRQRLVDLARPLLAVPWRAVLSRSGPRGAVNHQTKTRAASGVRACGAASIPRCCEAAAPQRASARGLVRVVQYPGEKVRLLAAWKRVSPRRSDATRVGISRVIAKNIQTLSLQIHGVRVCASSGGVCPYSPDAGPLLAFVHAPCAPVPWFRKHRPAPGAGSALARASSSMSRAEAAQRPALDALRGRPGERVLFSRERCPTGPPYG
jgi:hypothetical protein